MSVNDIIHIIDSCSEVIESEKINENTIAVVDFSNGKRFIKTVNDYVLVMLDLGNRDDLIALYKRINGFSNMCIAQNEDGVIIIYIHIPLDDFDKFSFMKAIADLYSVNCKVLVK